MIAARHRCCGANHNFDGTGLGDSQQAELQPLAKLADPRIAFAAASPGGSHSKPDLVAMPTRSQLPISPFT